MQIHEKYLEDFAGITECLTPEEVAEEVKDYIELMFAIRDEDHFNEIYEAFINQIK